jgi:hypothetical protein
VCAGRRRHRPSWVGCCDDFFSFLVVVVVAAHRQWVSQLTNLFVTTGWPEEFIANAIEHCRSNTGPQCWAAPYEVNNNNPNVAERRHVALRADMMLPHEIISPVPQIPRGDCPEIKAVGPQPDGTPFSSTTDQNNDTDWDSSGTNSTTSENGPHNDKKIVDDDAVDCSCTGTFFIICWFFRCLLGWLLF